METKLPSLDYELLARVCGELTRAHVELSSRSGGAVTVLDAARMATCGQAAGTAARSVECLLVCLANCCESAGAEDALRVMRDR